MIRFVTEGPAGIERWDVWDKRGALLLGLWFNRDPGVS